MDAMLQSRIQNLIGGDMPVQMAEGGMVEDPLTQEESMEYTTAIQEPVDKDADIRQAIEELMVVRDNAEDPFEAKKAEHLMEAALISRDAPLSDAALQVSQAGRGGDSTIAHLTAGEVVLPAEMMEDPRFESAVENRFQEIGLNPEEYVVGLGIASLNPQTGLEEFFLKKIAKFGKKVFNKVVRPVAKVAQFVPGPWQAPAALIAKADTVYKVATGEASPLALATLATGPKIFGDSGAIANITKAGGGEGFFKGLGSLAGQTPGAFKDLVTNLPSNLQSGVGSLFRDPSGTVRSVMSGAGLPGGQGVFGAPGVGLAALTPAEIAELTPSQLSALKEQDMLMAMSKSGVTQGKIEKIAEGLGIKDISSPGSIEKVFSEAQKLGLATGTDGTGGNFFSNLISGGGADGKGNYGALGDFLGGGLGTGTGTGSGGLGGLLGGAGGLAAAGLLGKLAYDEAKNRKGVALTPLTQEGSTGRYNIEAEIARRTGQPAPNPVEFGLLPKGTIPTLSGGKPPQQEAATGMRYGGMVMPMAYAKGGNVATEDFERMNGGINGEGTETSDDVPAMLSDGEFVMTGQAVRGAGAFDLSKGDGGIITLTPNGGESRGDGTALMYEMMDLFAEFADKPKPKRAKKK
jgi:hypothetical protein